MRTYKAAYGQPKIYLMRETYLSFLVICNLCNINVYEKKRRVKIPSGLAVNLGDT